MELVEAFDIAGAFSHHYDLSYGSPGHSLADNRKQFTAHFFCEMHCLLAVNNLFNTPYQPQANGQAERFTIKILAPIRLYIGNDPKEWELQTEAATYAYNAQSHSNTTLALFELVIFRLPPPL